MRGIHPSEGWKTECSGLPACAGSAICNGRLHPPKVYRMRDPPYCYDLIVTHDPSTPHARGSTMRELGKVLRHKVYPACAGIHPGFSLADSVPGGLPRMRGDPPTRSARPPNSPASTPHARGSTC